MKCFTEGYEYVEPCFLESCGDVGCASLILLKAKTVEKEEITDAENLV